MQNRPSDNSGPPRTPQSPVWTRRGTNSHPGGTYDLTRNLFGQQGTPVRNPQGYPTRAQESPSRSAGQPSNQRSNRQSHTTTNPMVNSPRPVASWQSGGYWEQPAVDYHYNYLYQAPYQQFTTLSTPQQFTTLSTPQQYTTPPPSQYRTPNASRTSQWGRGSRGRGRRNTNNNTVINIQPRDGNQSRRTQEELMRQMAQEEAERRKEHDRRMLALQAQLMAQQTQATRMATSTSSLPLGTPIDEEIEGDEDNDEEITSNEMTEDETAYNDGLQQQQPRAQPQLKQLEQKRLQLKVKQLQQQVQLQQQLLQANQQALIGYNSTAHQPLPLQQSMVPLQQVLYSPTTDSRSLVSIASFTPIRWNNIYISPQQGGPCYVTLPAYVAGTPPACPTTSPRAGLPTPPATPRAGEEAVAAGVRPATQDNAPPPRADPLRVAVDQEAAGDEDSAAQGTGSSWPPTIHIPELPEAGGVLDQNVLVPAIAKQLEEMYSHHKGKKRFTLQSAYTPPRASGKPKSFAQMYVDLSGAAQSSNGNAPPSATERRHILPPPAPTVQRTIPAVLERTRLSLPPQGPTGQAAGTASTFIPAIDLTVSSDGGGPGGADGSSQDVRTAAPGEEVLAEEEPPRPPRPSAPTPVRITPVYKRSSNEKIDTSSQTKKADERVYDFPGADFTPEESPTTDSGPKRGRIIGRFERRRKPDGSLDRKGRKLAYIYKPQDLLTPRKPKVNPIRETDEEEDSSGSEDPPPSNKKPKTYRRNKKNTDSK